MMKKFFCTKKSEDGVALIFALAMLALLLIMLIGFLASAILEQRIAYSYRDDTGSRLLVRSALVRVKSLLTATGDYPDDLLFMRNGAPEVTGKPDIVAPIVSINSDTSSSSTESDAYKALKPLLKKYFGPNGSESTEDIANNWEWRNWLPKNVNMYHPQWIYYYGEPSGTNRHITGRLAYVVVPNLGLNPLTMGNSERKGVKYEELPKTSLLTASGVTKLDKFNNWLSVDVLMGKEGLYNASGASPYINYNNLDLESLHSGKLGGIQGTSDQDWGKENAFATLFLNRTAAPTQHKSFTAADFNKIGKTPQVLTQHTAFANWQSFVNTNFDFAGDTAAANQAAANLTDYVDADSTPTSDIPPANWLTNSNHPAYTGNEKTPYINQLGFALQLKASYSYATNNLENSKREITQTVQRTPSGRFFAELINIYPETLHAGEVILKDFNLKLNVKSIKNGATQTDVITITQDEVTIPFGNSVPAKGYLTAEKEMSASIVGTNTLLSTSIIDQTAPIPELTIEVEVAEFKFAKAVLKNGEEYEDYAAALTMDNMPRRIVGTVLQTDADGNQQLDSSNSWAFSDKYVDQDSNTVKNISPGEDVLRYSTGYASFEVSDPRCNLQAANWESSMTSIPSKTVIATNLPNYGSKNTAAKDMKNDDLAKEQDLEPDDDPAKISTAYIRNAPMQSMRELGLIHRGKPWQTFNLHYIVPDPTLSNADPEPAKLDYKHDPIILERYRMNVENDVLFNVNHPANFTGAFAPLTTKVGYRSENQGAAITELNADAQKELRAWIANKCYKVTGSTPQEGEKYNRYVRHSELVPVIMDWAKNGNHSPLKGSSLCDAAIEDIVAQIVPLARFGEMFEYYTVFAVAQTIKDLGGTIYNYGDDGKLQSRTAAIGTLDACDQITSETCMVARLRRTITCQPVSGKYSTSCLWGHHKKSCVKTVTVLECYTLNLE